MTIPDAPNICSASKTYPAELLRVDAMDDLLKFSPLRNGDPTFSRHSAAATTV
jgi:hypothetical protein